MAAVVPSGAVAAAVAGAAAAGEGTVVRDMFGGAMQLELPRSFIDASDMRQVPDNQEVWIDATTAASAVLEILEPQRRVDGEAMLRFHYAELAKANGCAPDGVVVRSASTLDDADIPHLAGRRKYAGVLIGEQRAAKFNERHANSVAVCLCAVRLPPPRSADMLLTLNVPVQVDGRSSDAAAAPACPIAPPEQLIRIMARSLRVVDWDLFVPDDQAGLTDESGQNFVL